MLFAVPSSELLLTSLLGLARVRDFGTTGAGDRFVQDASPTGKQHPRRNTEMEDGDRRQSLGARIGLLDHCVRRGGGRVPLEGELLGRGRYPF